MADIVMYMSDDEIRKSWDNAIDKRDHVKILADRNCVSVIEMKEKLTELGVDGLDKRWYNNTRNGKKNDDEQTLIVNAEPKNQRNILTVSEAYAVADLIATTIFDEIRNDTEIDSLEWLINIVHAYEKLKERSGYVGLTDGGTENG